MAAVLSVMRQLHEMLAHLSQAQRRAPDAAAQALLAEVVALVGPPARGAAGARRRRAARFRGAALAAASARVRAAYDGPDLAGADLAGQDLRGRDLRGAHLRGALLIAADLRGADLSDADLLGADVRDADVRGADPGRRAVPQPAPGNALRGDAATTLPAHLSRPTHWTDRALVRHCSERRPGTCRHSRVCATSRCRSSPESHPHSHADERTSRALPGR